MLNKKNPQGSGASAKCNTKFWHLQNCVSLAGILEQPNQMRHRASPRFLVVSNYIYKRSFFFVYCYVLYVHRFVQYGFKVICTIYSLPWHYQGSQFKKFLVEMLCSVFQHILLRVDIWANGNNLEGGGESVAPLP